MKVLILLFFVGASQLMFLAQAQEHVITIPKQNESLYDILEEIENQSDFLFFYNIEDVNENYSIF